MSSFSSNEPRKLFVASVVLALMCGSVAGSRFNKATESYTVDSPPPPPVPWWKHPPPPPLRITWPPPAHHYARHPPSPPPPPPVTDDDSTPPPSMTPPSPHPSRLHQSPPPPPDEDRTALNGKHSRRPSSIDETGSNQLLVHTDSAPGQCSTDPGALAPGPPPRSTGVPYGDGGYVPVGAPYSAPVMSPEPAPESGGESNQPPPSGDNSTMAHTTMVSAMQYNQCTYTIITSTGNIEGAGTQADVNVEFFDKYGSSVLFVNLRSQSRNFNQGATDTFTVVGDCIQHICKMHLSHDDAGPNPGWFVNTVTVSLLYQTHVFNVFEWLAKDEPPYSLSRVVSSCPA